MIDHLRHMLFMQRAFQLAEFAYNNVASNPNVGALLVYQDKIIGEGYHEKFGQNHAEVNAIKSVRPEDADKIKDSILYVSLEPCCFYGKTPACTDLIIRNSIKEVYIGALDPNPKVAGEGIRILKTQGIQVSVLQEFQNKTTIKPFSANQCKRPYTILKWASSQNNLIGLEHKRVQISNKLTQVYTHNLRSRVDGILIGNNTLKVDDPELNTRIVIGNNPRRIVLGNTIERGFTNRKENDIYIGKHNDISNSLNILLDSRNLKCVLETLFEMGISRLLVEGGKSILNDFIRQNLWDEAIVIKSKKNLTYDSTSEKPVKAPLISGKLKDQFKFRDDSVTILINQ